MLGIRFALKVPPIPLVQPQRVAQVAEEVFLPAVEEGGMLALRAIKERTPVGATEALRGSVQNATDVIRGTRVEFRSTVSLAQPYAMAVESGSRPHWAPIGPLKLWSRRVLGSEEAAYAIQHHIAHHGTRPQRFFAGGVDAVRARVEARLRAAAEAFAARLMRGGR